jgi:uncharacterized secreted protein with C-terminal beta-propeller domain
MRLSLIFTAVVLLASCSEPASQPEPVAGPNTKLLSVKPPSNWKVIMDKPGFPIAMCVFQIPNPADVGGRESTNVVTASYAAGSKQAQDTLATTKGRFVKTNLRTSQQAGWDVESYSEIQGTTRYRILDGTKVQSDKTLFVRMAWPTLPGNSPGYDAEMQRAFGNLLTQVH